MNLADQLKQDYLNWFKEKIVFANITNAIEITTPFLNSNQDYIQIYAIKDGNNFILTDDGSTLNELYLVGFDIKSPKRKELLEGIIRNYGVSLSDSGDLSIKTTADQFPHKKHALLQAMLKVNDMLFLNRKTVKNIFFEDVRKFLWDNDIRSTPNLGLPGISGYTHNIDFAIPASKSVGERFIQTMNSLDRNKVQSTLFLWNDIKPARKGSDSSLFVFVNDALKQSDNHLEALNRYSVKVVAWDKRNEVIPMLSA